MGTLVADTAQEFGVAARDIPLHGPQLRLLRMRSGVSQRAVARAMGRRPARISTVENSIRVSSAVAIAFVEAVHAIVVARERLTLDDLR
jgi:transcriptional regulator with XRE-family HTH domain